MARELPEFSDAPDVHIANSWQSSTEEQIRKDVRYTIILERYDSNLISKNHWLRIRPDELKISKRSKISDRPLVLTERKQEIPTRLDTSLQMKLRRNTI